MNTGDSSLSFTAIRCPNCGADKVKSLRPDVYQCAYCGNQFTMVRPDVQRTDVVSHNCPICGKPIQAGTGYLCTGCKRGDLCPDCVDRLDVGYMCKDCLKGMGKSCFICGRLAVHVCGSCRARAERGQLKEDELLIQTCFEHRNDWFATYHREERRGRPPLWGKISFTCPNCGEICSNCAESKGGLFGSAYRCKNCGAKVNTYSVDM